MALPAVLLITTGGGSSNLEAPLLGAGRSEDLTAASLPCSLGYAVARNDSRVTFVSLTPASSAAAAAAKSLQSCPTLCDPMDSSPPGSPIPGILQARTLEWVATAFPNA